MNDEPILAHDDAFHDRRIYYSLWSLLIISAMAKGSVAPSSFGALFALLFWGIAFAIGLGFGYHYSKKGQQICKKLSDGIAFFGLFVFIFSLISGILPALLSLLLWMLLAKSFILTNKRDLFFVMLSTFVLIVFAASQSKSSLFLVYIVLYCLAGMYTLLLHHADSGRQRALSTQLCDSIKPNFPASTVILTSAIIACAALLYFIVPRPSAAYIGSFPSDGGNDYRNKEWEQEAKTGNMNYTPEQDTSNQEHNEAHKEQGNGSDQPSLNYAGFKPQFNLNQTGSTLPGNPIVLYLQAPHPLYLKGRSFDRFDGLSWDNSLSLEKKVQLKNGNFRIDPKRSQVATVQQIIEVAVPLDGLLYAAPRVVELDFPGTVIAIDQDRTLRIPSKLMPGTRYEVISEVETLAGRTITRVDGILDQQRYLQLPKDFEPEITRLAGKVMQTADTPLESALALESHLRTQYAYSVESIFNSQNVTPLKTFLFETKRGHCEYFASAMAMMLRSQGIAARLVTGFSATHYNPITGYYELRALDGHAWTEAYLPKYGWVSFEPTPFYPLPQPNQSQSTLEAMDAYLQRQKEIEEISADQPRSFDLYQTLKALMRDIIAILKNIYQSLSSLLIQLAPALGILILLGVAAGYAFYHWRMQLRDRLMLWRIDQGKNKTANDFVILCYGEMEAWFARRQLPRQQAETVEEYQVRLNQTLVAQEKNLATLSNYLSEVRYRGIKLDESAVKAVSDAFNNLINSPVTGTK